jgi:hypothetical protein
MQYDGLVGIDRESLKAKLIKQIKPEEKKRIVPLSKAKAAAMKINYPVMVKANKTKRPVTAKPDIEVIQAKEAPEIKEDSVHIVKEEEKPIIDELIIKKQEDLKERTEKIALPKEEEIDSNCPLCFQFMVQPRRLKCGHTFCAQCMKDHYRVFAEFTCFSYICNFCEKW